MPFSAVYIVKCAQASTYKWDFFLRCLYRGPRAFPLYTYEYVRIESILRACQNFNELPGKLSDAVLLKCYFVRCLFYRYT